MKVDTMSVRLSGGNEKPTNLSLGEESEQEATEKREHKIVHSVCSFQSRMGNLEYRKWRRVHGLQLPLHPLQVAGWIIFLAVGAATFLVLIPALRPLFRECILIVLGFLFCLHILSHFAALLLDPADPELRALKVKFTVPEFDRSKHAHVIENGRCHLCNIKTSGPRTKHCSVCNKCIGNFDHHCKWLNHCVGGRNYVAFLICVVSAVAASLVVAGVSVLEIVYYHVDPGLLNVFANPQNDTSTDLFLPDSVFLGIVSVLGLLAATTAGLLLHLCLFHCYISVLGITTYEYIRYYPQETSSQRTLSSICNYKKEEVLCNNAESSERNRNKTKRKFENCCYYSCSRPPEDDEFEPEPCCSRHKFSFSRTKNMLEFSGRRKTKTLERQNTDPEFVDRVIKPFLITLNEDKGPEPVEIKSENYCVLCLNERVCGCGVKRDGNKESSSEESSQEEVVVEKQQTRQGSSFKKFNWCPNFERRTFRRNSENSIKIKCNQIRPSRGEELNSQEGNVAVIKMENYPEAMDVHAFTAMKPKVLPSLNDTLRKLQSSDDLKELSSVFDLVDKPNFAFQMNAKSNFRRVRRKNMAKRTPPLSPIRESGLSNPGSPRVDLIMPPTPTFVRPSSPEISTIFLSNPNSPSSSDDDDDDVVVTPSATVIARRYEAEDILRTPQLPRKMFANSKDEQIFVLKPTKLKSTKWIDVEIANGV